MLAKQPSTQRRFKKWKKKAVQRQYKKDRKNGGSYIFKPFRRGTGDNYNKAEEAFYKRMANDSTYRDLSKKAYDAEKKRLLAEKRYVDDDDEYSKYYSSKNAQRLLEESMKATAAKENYANKAVKFFAENELKDAKIKDLNITENIELAKKYLKTDKNIFYWDENLEYNPDSYYGDWVEKSRFK